MDDRADAEENASQTPARSSGDSPWMPGGGELLRLVAPPDTPPVRPTVSNPTRVGIGLIRRGDRYLIRQRPHLPGSPMAGYWEFPGGKCEPGESPEDCTRRECVEEAGLAVVIQARRRIVRHIYPHGSVEMHFFDCLPETDDAEPAPGTGFIWVGVQELPHYTFPGANETIVADLIREAWAGR